MKRIAVLVTVLALAVPSVALAQGGSTCQGYSSQTCASTAQRVSTTVSSGSTLPFTGLDVALLAVGAGVLLGTGLILRRITDSIR